MKYIVVNVTTRQFHYNIVKYKVMNITRYVVTFTTLIIHYIVVNPKVVNVTTLCSDVHYFVFTVYSTTTTTRTEFQIEDSV